MKHTADHYDYKELSEPRRLAETIRAACVQAALDGYEDARTDGLCHEGPGKTPLRLSAAWILRLFLKRWRHGQGMRTANLGKRMDLFLNEMMSRQLYRTQINADDTDF